MFGKDNVMYDLHGLSESQAETLVSRVIRETSANTTVRLRFITGRGNHTNSKGQRGTLFTQFPEWIKQSPYAERIEKVEPYDGHYEVYVKPTLLNSSYESKLKQFSRQYFSERIESIRAAAEAADPESMVLYGQLIEAGEHVKQDLKKTVSYFRRAAEAGYPEGMHEYARCWLHGIGVRQSDENAKKWLEKASDSGFIPSTVTLAKSYAYGVPGYPKDTRKAIELHHICVQAGNTDAMRFFGSMYLSGNDVKACLATSFYWYKRAADMGDAKAQFNVAVMYLEGSGTAKNLTESDKYFKLAANGGDVEAQYIYARTLLRAGDKHSKEQGTIWLFTAADNGSEQANQHLSRLLPPEEARTYLARSAQAGNLHSQMRLNTLDGKPADFGISLAKIIERYRSLTEVDIMHMTADAKYFLLDRILLEAPSKDKRKAFKLIKSMAESNCTYALRRQAYFYTRGNSSLKINSDAQRALKLIQQSATLKDPIAMVQLAKFYLTQNMSHKDIEITQDLLLKAASKKYPPAFYELGLMYHNGFLGNNKASEALKYFQSAIQYEKTQGHVENFAFGPLDEYEAVSTKSQQLADQLLLSAKIASSKPRVAKPTSGITVGFFKPTQSNPQDDIKPTTTRMREFAVTIPPDRASAPTPNTHTEELLSTPTDTQAEPNQSPWSFFSKPSVLAAASLVALTIIALRQ